MSGRSSNVKQLLQSNVRWLNASSRRSRPGSRVRSCEAVIEYAQTPSLLNKHGSVSATGLSGTACELVGVTDAAGNVLKKFPHVLRQALLGAASARTNEKMAREFFGTLKRVGRVALREVDRPQRPAPAPVRQPVVAPVPQEDEPEVDAMEALRLEMASQEDWDAESEEERNAREKKERKEKRKRSLARWVAKREFERKEAREARAATLFAAAWRGHVCRQNAKALELLIERAQVTTEEERDDASQLREWLEDEAEAKGVTVEELVLSAEAEEPPGTESSDWDDWEEEDRYEREWEEYKADRRLARMWG